jgi:outer membrane lipoprotein-sorting protein
MPGMTLRRLVAIVLPFVALLLAIPPAAVAQQVDATAINTYLSGLRSAEGTFRQTNPNGSVQTGRFYLQKPGRIRFEYDTPKGAMVIADGSWVGVFDPKSNRNPTRYPLNSTPLGLLLRDRISLSQPGLVQGATRDATTTRITVVDPENPKAGQMVMSFTNQPIALTSWEITTQTGARTRVDLTTLTPGVAPSRSLFNIELAATAYKQRR